MWTGFADALTLTALSDAIAGVLSIPIVPAVGLATVAIALVVFALRRIGRLAPRS
jgi:hypothetical protein